jgi:hypothetical protein
MSSQDCVTPLIPKENKWKSASAYKKETESIKRALRWLCCCPLQSEIVLRSQANAYVLEWLAGTPTISLNIETKYLTFLEEYPELLFTFLHGAMLYCLEQPKQNDASLVYLHGYETVIRLSKSDKVIWRSETMKHLRRLMKKKELQGYIEALMSE